MLPAMAGPLAGVRVIEIAGIGPGPFCGMMLADMGAEVLRVDRAASSGGAAAGAPRGDVLARGRRSVGVDLKRAEGVDVVLRLVERADALYEGFRPGVMERLGLGPDVCLARNPRLVYGRMTGWGQEGPLAHAAGHDIDYIALAGALGAIGPRGGKPVPPLNLVGDFGGGGMLLAFGMACALYECARSGRGQVVDAAMVDGAAALMAVFYPAAQTGWWREERGANLLDGGAPFYDAYETKDGKHVAVGAIEPQFWAELVRRVGLAGEALPEQNDRAAWPALKERLAALFRTKTREEWCAILEGSDACFAPVLSLAEAPAHPHARARGAFVERAGFVQPAPAPRFSRTAPALGLPPALPGEHTERALADWGFGADEIRRLREAKAIA
jgi:alpha-methylacyl-CoA racemase